MARTQSPTRRKAAAAKPAKSTAAPAVAAPVVKAPAPVNRQATLRQLAHELNSLLDGSMRCVGMARSSIKTRAHGAESAEDGLAKALSAMKHMAALLERAMKLTTDCGTPSTVALFHTDQTIARSIDDAMHVAAPLADSLNVTLKVEVADACREVCAGPLGVVLLNGLRNAIESCGAQEEGLPREVRLAVETGEDQTLLITIADTGAAAMSTQPSGSSHGIGLALSQQIVRELGGDLGLLIHDHAAGATLRISTPLRSLRDGGSGGLTAHA